MRKVIGWLLSWLLFWLGDLISKPMNYLNWVWLYPAYNNLMSWSYNTQVWGGDFGPWRSHG